MDQELVLNGIAAIKEGKVALKGIVAHAQKAEVLAAAAMALKTTILDGSIYKRELNPTGVITTLQDYAFLHYTLKSLHDLGDELKKMAAEAIKGSDAKFGADGHSQRFAEMLRASGQNKASFDGLGSFTIYCTTEAFPPGKDKPDKYEAFRLWLKDKHPELCVESWNWKGFQKLIEEMEKEQRPDFVTVREREEVRFKEA